MRLKIDMNIFVIDRLFPGLSEPNKQILMSDPKLFVMARNIQYSSNSHLTDESFESLVTLNNQLQE